jgi:hypothetical protein
MDLVLRYPGPSPIGENRVKMYRSVGLFRWYSIKYKYSLNLSLALFPRWGHLAPTCPDTIGCFPYFEQDPFILDTLPDVFIAGNQVR